MAVNLSDHFAQRREQHGRRLELQRLGVDDAAVRTPRVTRDPLDLAKASADGFVAMVEAKTARGLSPGDALIEAAAADPSAYDNYVRVTTLAKDGTVLASSVKPTFEKTKKVSSTFGPTTAAAWDIIQDNAAEIVRSTGCSQADALTRALSENPSLYAEYVQEFHRRTGSELPAERG